MGSWSDSHVARSQGRTLPVGGAFGERRAASGAACSELAQHHHSYRDQRSAVAVDSAYAQQAVTNTGSFQLVREVANLVRTASADTDQQDEGRVLAAQIEAELAGDAKSNPGKLKQLMFTAATAFAGALGSAGGTDLAQLAMQAYTML